MFEIVALDDTNEKKFWDYVLSDIPLYFFFILDLKQYPEESRFFMALENDCIVGLCLIWKNHIAHVRGKTEDVVKTLFNAIPEEIPVKQINFEYRYKALLKALFPNPKHEISMHRMMLKKEKIFLDFL